MCRAEGLALCAVSQGNDSHAAKREDRGVQRQEADKQKKRLVFIIRTLSMSCNAQICRMQCFSKTLPKILRNLPSGSPAKPASAPETVPRTLLPVCRPEVFPGHAKMQVRPGWVPRGMHEAKRMFVSHRKPFPGAGCIVSCPEAFPGRK